MGTCIRLHRGSTEPLTALESQYPRSIGSARIGQLVKLCVTPCPGQYSSAVLGLSRGMQACRSPPTCASQKSPRWGILYGSTAFPKQTRVLFRSVILLSWRLPLHIRGCGSQYRVLYNITHSISVPLSRLRILSNYNLLECSLLNAESSTTKSHKGQVLSPQHVMIMK